LSGYVQNHTVPPEQGFELAAPYTIATERDSVIELKFDGIAGIERLLAIPSYQQHVRPDEASFNDLPHNIMVLTEAAGIFHAHVVGPANDDGFGKGSFDYVRELWAISFDALSAVASRSFLESADGEKSFSVFATEFPMHGSVD
jgi:hypothetical protein